MSGTPLRKIYHLGTCSTCQKILQQISPEKKGFELQDIKKEKITPSQLDEMKKRAGSYEALFSRRSLKYRAMGLQDKALTEKDYRRLILEEYTFLKRPVMIDGDHIYIGSTKTEIAKMVSTH